MLLEHFIFVDYGLKDLKSRTTGETETDYDLEFTTKIIERDRLCIATGTMECCDAAHLIPRIKGNEVICSSLMSSLMTGLIVPFAGY